MVTVLPPQKCKEAQTIPLASKPARRWATAKQRRNVRLLRQQFWENACLDLKRLAPLLREVVYQRRVSVRCINRVSDGTSSLIEAAVRGGPDSLEIGMTKVQPEEYIAPCVCAGGWAGRRPRDEVNASADSFFGGRGTAAQIHLQIHEHEEAERGAAAMSTSTESGRVRVQLTSTCKSCGPRAWPAGRARALPAAPCGTLQPRPR